MKRGLDEWINIGERRIISVLNKNIGCTERQLQLKICEAGPNNQRLEPIVLNKAGDNLFKNKKINSKKIKINNNNISIYYCISTPEENINKRVEDLTKWYNSYFSLIQLKSGQYCGNILEKMIIDSINDTNKYNYFSNIYKEKDDGIFVIQNGNLNIYNGNYTSNPLDCIAIIKENNIGLGIEIKNKTEWKYGSDIDIWKMIKKCCELNLLPIFVARKIPAITKFFFKKAGILGMETQFQYLHISCKEKFKDIIKKENLGYAHIKFETKYRPFMKKYFNDLVIEFSEEYYERFRDNKDLLYKYSIELCSKNLNHKNRTIIYKEIKDLIYKKYDCDLEIAISKDEFFKIDNLL